MRSLRKYYIAVVAAGFVVTAFVQLLGFLNFFLPLADSFSHFRLHLAIATIVALILFLLAKVWHWALAALVAIIVAIVGLAPGFPHLNFTPAIAGSDPAFKFVQFNTLFKNPKPEVSAQWILNQQPDIVTLQEVSKATLPIYDKLSSQLPSHVICKFASVGAVAVLSYFPKIDEKCIEGKGLVWMRVIAHGKPVTIASLHLHWPYPYRQWQQIESLRTELEAMPRPVILAGDFNAAPWSEAVRRIGKATSTELQSGTHLTLRMGALGFGPYPALPLDHLLLPLGANGISVAAGPPIGSDHLPIVGTFRIDAKPSIAPWPFW